MIPTGYFDPIPQDDGGMDEFDYDEKVKAGCFQSVIFFSFVIIAMAICSLFSSCTTTRYVPVVEHKTDTLWQNRVQKDSVYLHDSTYIRERGDTVLIERWHTRYREKEVHDTTYISKTDSVPAPYPVEKEVPAELTWWQQTRIRMGDILLWAWLIIALYYLAKWLIKINKP